MDFEIDSLLPSDVLDEIIVADQEHVLANFDKGEFTEDDVNSFINQCRSFDMIRVRNLYTNSMLHNKILHRVYSEMKECPKYFTVLDNITDDKKTEYHNKGLEAIGGGRVALVLLAGGQASRLHIPVVKGNVDFGLPSHKTIFQRTMHHIRHIQSLAKTFCGHEVELPIYIMTSESNQTEIERKNSYYGLYHHQLHFFQQGSFPCIDSNGHFIMHEKHKIALSPNGSGGLFFALHHHHIVDEWKHFGIEFVHIFGMDNACEIPADPTFIGFSLTQNSDICLKCVEKSCPEERLSMLSKYGDKAILAIHSEMNYRQICQRDDIGDLIFRYGFIFDSIITIKFILQRCNESSLPLYCHVVKKAIPYYDTILNRTIKPINPNAFKLEYYLSDVIPNANQISALIVPRTEYAPIKNPPNKPIESPEKAAELLLETHRQYMMKLGIITNDNRDEVIELSSLVTIRGEGLERLSGISMKFPCIVIDRSELNEDGEDDNGTIYSIISDGVGIINKTKNGYYQYIFL